MPFFSKKIAIDLGTANSLVYVPHEGVLFDEPTVVAVSSDDGKVVAVGSEAKEMLGRAPEAITVSRPLRDGVIADYVITEAILGYFIGKVCGSTRLVKPEVMISVPAGVSSVESRAVLEAAYGAGAGTAYLIPEPLAAAIGAKLPIAEPSGNMIVNLGGGTTEVAIISLGGIVVRSSVRAAGNKLDEAILLYIRRKYGLLIGDQTAEEVKIGIGSAIQSEEKSEIEVRGRDLVAGLPRTIVVSSNEVTSAIQPVLEQITGSIRQVLEKTPPELSSDVIDKGLFLSGGTALLRGLDKYITGVTGVPAHVVEDPLLCVVKGVGLAIENLSLFEKNLTHR
ncbi:MAG: rod shape-determining protein [bacterium]|nr:rod shape-determining protein [bacterium]